MCKMLIKNNLKLIVDEVKQNNACSKCTLVSKRPIGQGGQVFLSSKVVSFDLYLIPNTLTI